MKDLYKKIQTAVATNSIQWEKVAEYDDGDEIEIEYVERDFEEVKEEAKTIAKGLAIKALTILGAITALMIAIIAIAGLVALVNRGAAWQVSQALSAASDWAFNASEYFFNIVVK
ncbi:hypothetical protein ACLOE0_03040 [Limosilactobacillus fermentum]|uniref:hypothetical protein n=1 Tax=Limosilactobacillus fermentum TaxID=1613 RepID=UPI003EBD2001